MEKGLIEQIGKIDEDGMVTDFTITGGDFPGIDYTVDPPVMCGYTVEELRRIIRAKEVLSGQITTDKPILIPAGRYAEGVFSS